jgi:hypothetical protein
MNPSARAFGRLIEFLDERRERSYRGLDDDIADGMAKTTFTCVGFPTLCMVVLGFGLIFVRRDLGSVVVGIALIGVSWVSFRYEVWPHRVHLRAYKRKHGVSE